ncbi:MAG: hypothetical protein COV69_02170 [Parcubacteria group bacterium CG11_big_fil_rev_8_21_14_0_20_39_14]|nr:MAG: hypothetical protein COV69_02170 [Parcubacteria group bacterium CG11_big_fil_rev_8_21_14_0_20_39_14]
MIKKIGSVLLALILTTILSFSGLISTVEAEENVNAKIADWTFMLYAFGDNNLCAFTVEKLDELELLDYSSGRVKIICFFDDLQSGAKIYEIVQDDTPSTINSKVLKDLGEVNMGDPDVLLDFLTFSGSNFPAAHYGLIILGHGNPTWGLGPDEHLGSIMAKKSSGILTLGELKITLKAFKTGTDITLDIIGFDACLMGTFEVASVLKDYANIMIASPTVMHTETWADVHIFLSLLKDPAKSPEDFAKKVVEDSLIQMIIDEEGYWQPPTRYLIAVDLSYIPEIIDAFSRLNSALISQLQASPESALDFDKAVMESNKFAGIHSPQCHLGLWTLDILVFAKSLQALDCSEIKDKADKLREVLERATIAEPGKANYFRSFSVYASDTSVDCINDFNTKTKTNEYLKEYRIAMEKIKSKEEPSEKSFRDKAGNWFEKWWLTALIAISALIIAGFIFKKAQFFKKS